MTSILSKIYPTAVQTTPQERLDQPDDSYDRKLAADTAVERRVLVKCDLHVLPILFLLFLVSFVDRVNIGNAKIQGLEASLGMVGNQYNIAVFVFYVPYCLLDLPSNLLLRQWKPAPMLAIMMFCWGLATMGQGLTHNFAGLVASRVIMGIFEAGFVPGCAYLIGLYYKRHEFQLRYSFFFCAAILAGAFGGFLAYLLQKLDGKGGFEGWRWIFLIEGILTCIVAVFAYFVIVPWPKDCNFLKPEEKAILLKRLEADSAPGQMDHGSIRAFLACLRDPKILLFMLAYFGADNTASSFAAFQPTLVQALGYKPADAQVHTIPVYMVAFVCSLIAAYASDRLAHRYAFCLLGTLFSTIGWAIQLATEVSAQVHYFSLFLTLAGTYILMPVLVVWGSNNMGGSYKRSVATGIQIGGGNLANFCSSNVFLPREAPVYHTAYSVGLGLQLMAMLCCTALVLIMWRENRRRNKAGRAPDGQGYGGDEKQKLGDDHPAFRYTL